MTLGNVESVGAIAASIVLAQRFTLAEDGSA
jgi:hypothetical protein